MGVLDVLSGLSTAAGRGYQGYGEDQQLGIKNAMATRKAADDAERNRALNLLTQRQVAKPQLGDENFAKLSADVAGQEASAKVPAAVSEASLKAPIAVKQATDTAAGLAPIAQATHRANRVADLETEPDKIVGGMGPDGKPLYARVGQTGPAHPIEGLSPKPSAAAGALAAPIAAKVGQFGEMLKKAHDLTSLTDNLDVSVGQSATRDLAEHGFHVPLIGTLPGSKGLGNAMMSKAPEYAQYQAALSPFILAAAHALSGARINQDQVEQIRKSIELAPGDFTNKAVRAQKEKNMIDLINSIGGSLPKDAIGEQEGQMDEPSIQGLMGRGYKRVGGHVVAPAGGHGDPEFDALMAKYKKP